MDATLWANNSQHRWMLHVASACAPRCMLLRVVAQCLKPVKLLCYLQTDTTTPNIVGQQCWELLRPLAGSIRQYSVIPYVLPEAKCIIFW